MRGYLKKAGFMGRSIPDGKLTCHMFAALAAFERPLILERTQAGWQAASARGRVGGRPQALPAS